MKNLKFVISVIILVVVLSMNFCFAGMIPKDVKDTKYELPVDILIELGVVNAYPEGVYLPNNEVTRAEIAKNLVCANGLESLAEVSKGETPFSDVPADHWASGYINVSAEYGYVNGDPGGKFYPEKTFTYAEAITVCLRVLGYGNEVDSQGTWPTSYIAKAEELKLTKNIEYSSYNDAINRGDLAILLWNMLKTEMWVITGESEGDGLISAPSAKMLNVKFPDYRYEEDAVFNSYTIEYNEDKEESEVEVMIDEDWYTYTRNDFYKFIPASECEVVLNSDTEELIAIIPSGNIVEKTKVKPKDVKGTDYEFQVNSLIELGILNAYPDGTYLPDNVVTKSEMIKTLVVAYGLEDVADSARGETPFEDVSADHWASGYINVACNYGFIDVSQEEIFRPDDTITYTEALTYILRVLGYKQVIEARGSYPVNYLSKAIELDLMEEVKFNSYNDGVIRGNSAILLFNMLQTPMCNIDSDYVGYETEKILLDFSFDDIVYSDEAIFKGFYIENNKISNEPEINMHIDDMLLKYNKNDFYTFVPGMKVGVLYNTKENTLLTIVPVEKDKLIRGTKEKLVSDGYTYLSGEDFDYLYGVYDTSGDMPKRNMVNVRNYFIDDVERENRIITITTTSGETLIFTKDEANSQVCLEEWSEEWLRERLYWINVGEVLSKIEVRYSNNSEVETFWIISDENLVQDVESLLNKHIGIKDIVGTKYELAVNSLIELGIINSFPDGTLMPNKVVTKAEMLKALVVAYGLEDVAELVEGTTPFSDVEANHWASGYINVACDMGFTSVELERKINNPNNNISGDNLLGCLRPNEVITYSEAMTYCLRTLGYGNVADCTGTWPTAYIVIAKELNLMEGIEFTSWNDGVTRGNFCMLIWNMMKTKMWSVDGSDIGKKDETMLDVKFPSFEIVNEDIFNGYEIVSNSQNEAEVIMGIGNRNFEYEKNDFYTFVPGTEVKALLNNKEKTLLVMIPTDDNRLTEGTKEELDGDYLALDGENFDYVYGLQSYGDLENNTMLFATSYYIDEAEISGDNIILTSNGLEKLIFDIGEEICLRDGERVTFDDVVVGDILTKVRVKYSGVSSDDRTFWIIGTEEIEGVLTKCYEAEYEDGILYHVIRIDRELVVLDENARYVEYVDEYPIVTYPFYSSANETMKNETVVVKMSPIFNKAVRIEFDGKIGENLLMEVEPKTSYYVIGSDKYFTWNIESITILNEIPPIGSGESWDVSYYGDGSIIAWVEESSVMDGWSEQMYDLYIASNEIIVPESCNYLFEGYQNCVSIEGLEYLDTSSVKSMDFMFAFCTSLKNLDVSHLDTSRVVSMISMFESCDNLTSLDLDNFDTRRVRDMSAMFFGCDKLESLDLSGFDTNNVENMDGMFFECSALTSLDISEFDTSNVENMNGIFYECKNLISLDVSNFDTSKVTDMSSMFWNCSGLTSLDVSEFDTSNVTDMACMFGECGNLTNLDLTNFETSNVINMRYMFYKCYDLSDLDLSSFDTSSVEDMSNMFESAFSLRELDLSNFDTSKVTNMSCMFKKCTSLISLDVSNFDTSNVKDMNDMFYSCKSLTTLNISNFDTSKVTDMSNMFSYCSNLTSLDVSNFDTSNVKDMSNMFYSCKSLTTLNISNFDTSKVTNMSCMFSNCSDLTSLDVSSFNTTNVTDMVRMLENCDNLKLVLIGENCTFLEQIPNQDISIVCTSIATTDSDIISLSSTELKDKLTFYVPNTDVEKIYEGNSNYLSVFGVDRIKPIMSLSGSNPATVVTWAEYKDAGVKIAGYTSGEIDFSKFRYSVVTSGDIDTSKEGTNKVVHTLKYSSGDSEIELMQVERTVNIVPNELGDTNSDGAINSTDLQRLYSHLNGSNAITNEEHLVVFDVNGDGQTNSTDLQRLYTHLNGSNPLK